MNYKLGNSATAPLLIRFFGNRGRKRILKIGGREREEEERLVSGNKMFLFFGETGSVLEKGGKETQGRRHFYFRLVPPPNSTPPLFC